MIRRAGALIGCVVRLLEARPRLRAVVTRTLGRFPRAKRRLKEALATASRHAAAEAIRQQRLEADADRLSAHGRRVLNDLERERKKLSGVKPARLR